MGDDQVVAEEKVRESVRESRVNSSLVSAKTNDETTSSGGGGNNGKVKPSSNQASQESKLRSLMTKDIPKLASFVPSQLLKLFAEEEEKKSIELHSSQETNHTLVMLADITGFTKLSENLCSRGPEGVDELSEIISDFLGELISIVRSYQGDIVSFAGDALIITWPTNCEFGDGPQCVEQTLRVFKCALDLTQLTRPQLTLHIGVASGRISFCVIGGVEDYWSCLVIGEAIIRMGDAERHAASQEAVATLEAFEKVQEYCEGEMIEEERVETPQMVGDFNRKRGLVRLLEVRKSENMIDWFPDPRFDPYDLKTILNENIVEERADCIDQHLEKLTRFSNKLQSFIPEPAKEVLRGHGQYLNEFRKRISVLFVMLDDFPMDIYDPNHDGEAIRVMFQDILVDLQRVLFSYNGLMRQFIVDDKGCVFIACFGLAGHTHRDDPCRALSCGLYLAQALQNRKIGSYIGLSTGEAFCGAVGCVDRREYAMVGRDVNLAARLMSYARKNCTEEDQVMLICNEPTYEETKTENHVTFQALPPVLLKGSDNLVPIYKATLSQQHNKERRGSNIGRTLGHPVIGREAEMQTILNGILDRNNRRSYIAIVEGTQGIGKTTMLHAVKENLPEQGIYSMYMKALVTSRSTPFGIFRQIFWHLLDESILGMSSFKKGSGELVSRNTGLKDDIEKPRRESFKRLLERVATMHMQNIEKAKFDKSRASLIKDDSIDLANKSSKNNGLQINTMDVLHDMRTGSTKDTQKDRNSPVSASSMIYSPTNKGAGGGNNGGGMTGRQHHHTEVQTKGGVVAIAPTSPSNGKGKHQMSMGSLRFRSRRSSDPNLSTRPTMTAEFGDIEEGKESEKRELDERSVYIRNVLFPYLKSILRLPWNIEDLFGGTAPRTLPPPVNAHANSGQQLINLTLQALMEKYKLHDARVAIFIDDAHNMDSMSGHALSTLVQVGKSLVSIVMSQKPLETIADWQTDFSQLYNVHRVEVNTLSTDELVKIIATVSDTENMSDNIKSFILAQSHGNPGQCKELSMSLRYVTDASFMEDTAMTRIIEHAIQARFDRLPDTHRALLKTAAVIGNVFPIACLQTMVPRFISRKGLDFMLTIVNELVSGEWLDIAYEHGEEMLYSFRSEQVRNICYNLNTSRNLKMLHLSAAQYFEKAYDDDLRPYFTLLSYHYKHSNNDQMALKFMVYSFRLNLSIGAVPEAFVILDSILVLRINQESRLQALLQLEEAITTYNKSNSISTNPDLDAFVPQSNRLGFDDHLSSGNDRGSSGVGQAHMLKRMDSMARHFDINKMINKIMEAKADNYMLRKQNSVNESITTSSNNANLSRTHSLKNPAGKISSSPKHMDRGEDATDEAKITTDDETNQTESKCTTNDEQKYHQQEETTSTPNNQKSSACTVM